MKASVFALLLAVLPLTAADQPPAKPQSGDSAMQRAIAFERYKDLAAARQARKEAVHPSVTYSQADRSAEPQTGSTVKDPGESQWQKDKPQPKDKK
jgi:hypothetical protein